MKIGLLGFAYRVLPIMLLVLVPVATTDALEQTFKLEFKARLERAGAGSVGLPASLQPGLEIAGVVVLGPSAPLTEAPEMQTWGRGWKHAIRAIGLGRPLGARFNHGLMTQSDGLVGMVHDPLGGRDYELRARLEAFGELRLGKSAIYEPIQFSLFQSGHPDQRQSLQSLIREMAARKSARLFVRYRDRDRRAPDLKLVFSVGDMRVSAAPADAID
ncbi:MAG: hypothetical protein R3E48_21160 [Burkholderiaceae bacterium]